MNEAIVLPQEHAAFQPVIDHILSSFSGIPNYPDPWDRNFTRGFNSILSEIKLIIDDHQKLAMPMCVFFNRLLDLSFWYIRIKAKVGNKFHLFDFMKMSYLDWLEQHKDFKITYNENYKKRVIYSREDSCFFIIQTMQDGKKFIDALAKKYPGNVNSKTAIQDLIEAATLLSGYIAER